MKKNLELEKKALKFADKAHEGVLRKDGEEFIQHPIQVAQILDSHGFDSNVIAAGYLHDVIEDTQYTKEDLLNEFGEEVVSLVLSNTEDKSKTWKERKTATIEKIKTLTFEEKALLAADKLANVIDIERALNQEDDISKYWALFNAPYSEQKWYYKRVANELVKTLRPKEKKQKELFIMLKDLTDEVFSN